MRKIPLRGQAVCNRIVWLSELKLLLDIKDNRNCCNLSYESCRGMS